MYIWACTFVFVIVGTVASSDGNIEKGITYSDTYRNATIISTRGKIGLKMCGRRCIYQDQCEGINYNPTTLVCELLKAGGTSEILIGYLYSPINTWKMEHDICFPNPCGNMNKCMKTKYNGHVCVKTVAYYSNITLISSQYFNNDIRTYGYFDAGTGVRWLARFVTMDTESGYDLIRIYDGQSEYTHLLATESGTTLPGDVVTYGQYIFITWTTDGSSTFGGWRIDLYRKYQ